MMMMPSVFGENLFDKWMNSFSLKNFWDDSNFPFWNKEDRGLMKTDVKEENGNYLVDMELPGFNKEDVKLQLQDGYLTISATNNISKEAKDKEGNYIRRERYTGQCTRTFYVGDDISEEDIKAKFDNGILKLSIPKKEAKISANDRFIPIE